MTSFVLENGNEGHIKALSRAIQVSSKISKAAMLEFTPEKMRLCARTDIFLAKFVFSRGFFTEYNCDRRHRCFINLRALSMPFKSSILLAERDMAMRIKVRCNVEDEINNQIVFKIGADPPATTLTYRLNINDLEQEGMNELNAFNRTIEYARVEIVPKQGRSERFLLSAFNNFAPDIDQVTIKTSQSEIKFIGSTSPGYRINATNPLATSEFTHKRDDFYPYTVREDINVTVPLRYLKMFLNFVETSRVTTAPKYIFEGMGLPAHFMYDSTLFKAQFVSATPFEFIPEELEDERVLPIGMGGPNESFIADENVIQAEDENFEIYNQLQIDDDEEENEDDGYNDNQSECSDLLDGNLDGLNPTAGVTAYNQTNSIFGVESIRSEMRSETVYDPEKVREVINIDQDPDEIENVEVHYSSDSSED